MVKNSITYVRKAAVFAVLSLLIAALAACSDDDPASPGDPAEDWDYRAMTHPDSVTANFRDIYASMDAEAYAAMLAEDFKFVLKQEIDGDLFWNRETDAAIMDRMCAGEPGSDGAAVAYISVNLLRQDSWQSIEIADPFFGGTSGQYRPYQINLFIERPEPAQSFLVTGLVLFYVIPVDTPAGGECRLLGIVDRTHGGAGLTEAYPWSDAKALYRPPAQ